MKSIVTLWAACLVLASHSVWAEDLRYQPINPSFGGDPFNSQHLLQTAQIQNQHKADTSSNLAALFEDDPLGEQFLRSLNSRLVSSAVSSITDAIFEDGGTEGTFEIDNATVTYVRTGDVINVTLNDGISTTTLTVPVVSGD